jgi:molecular chaperone GrpE
VTTPGNAPEPGPAEESPAEEAPASEAGGPDWPVDQHLLAGELAGRLDKMEAQLAEFHRRSAHRESVIDRLHEENQRLHGGLGRIILEPVVTDLVRLYDQLQREVRRLEADGQDARLIWSFGEDVAQILDRCGVEVFSAEPGDRFDRGRHRALAVVACDDESRHNTVAEVAAAGFLERDTGRIRRPVQVRVHQYFSPSQSPSQ